MNEAGRKRHQVKINDGGLVLDWFWADSELLLGWFCCSAVGKTFEWDAIRENLEGTLQEP